MAKIVLLNSGFCISTALVEFRKKEDFAHALIKKRKYWPKHIKGAEINAHFKCLEFGTANAIRCNLDQVPFHVFAMKEPDYIIMVMSIYGTNERNDRLRIQWVYWDHRDIKKNIFHSLKLLCQTIFVFTPSITRMNVDMLQRHWSILCRPSDDIMMFSLFYWQYNWCKCQHCQTLLHRQGCTKTSIGVPKALAKANINNRYILDDPFE